MFAEDRRARQKGYQPPSGIAALFLALQNLLREGGRTTLEAVSPHQVSAQSGSRNRATMPSPTKRLNVIAMEKNMYASPRAQQRRGVPRYDAQERQYECQSYST
jgi:hypothetical protein